MEVHHHPDLHHKRKHFKEYFLEFLMIFLAVTMGFFAESYRENLVSHSKEREYIEQLVGDLKEDISECRVNDKNDKHSVADIDNNLARYCDTLINLLSKSNPARAEIISAYYYYNRITFDWFTPYFKDATWSQLRYNGGFSNIRNQNVIREINEYYKWVGIVNDYKDEVKQRYAAISYNEGRKVFDQRMEQVLLDSIDNTGVPFMFQSSESITKYISSTTPIQFAFHDPETILKLCNDLRSYKSLLKSSIVMIREQAKRAEELVQVLTKEYDIH